MQAFLLALFISILNATISVAAAIPDFDFLPSWDWILGEPTVQDPIEQKLEQENLFDPGPNLDDTAGFDPSLFDTTPPDSILIDPGLSYPALPDSSAPNPALLDPSDVYPLEISRGRPNCGNGLFGPNVPLCCDGLMIPGGLAINGCEYHDPGKKKCKNSDNVVCCQHMSDGIGYGCWKYY